MPKTSIIAAILAGVALFATGCASAPPSKAPGVKPTGDPLADGRARLAAAPAKDKVLWQYRLAAATLRRGEPDAAKPHLDAALATAAANYGNVNAEAAKSRRVFRRESDKPFIGEPHERAMANYYRAILYWRDGEPDNARALLRTASLIDSDAADKTRAGDYILFDYLEGLATVKLGGDGSDALARAQASAAAQNRPAPPPYDPQANVLCFVEHGKGPYKRTRAPHNSLLFYVPGEANRIATMRLEVAGRVLDLPTYDDIVYQAATHGAREMDKVLRNKAKLKDAANVATAAAIAPVYLLGALTHNSSSEKITFEDGVAKLLLAAPFLGLGLASHVLSGSIHTAADTRQWDNLPRYLSFGALRLPPGEHPATLLFIDGEGVVLFRETQRFTITVPAPPATGEAPRDVVIYRSQLTQ
ncbi:MAG: hypothetical protein LBM92_07475 [Opitutaceae bacterium]|nr:hypothetical protein [Opitutaceae bacterium]